MSDTTLPLAELGERGLVEERREFGRFLDHLVHEVRTPLTSIQGYAALLAEERAALDPEHRAWVDVIGGQAGRLHLQLGLALEIAGLWSGRRTLQFRKFDLARVTRSAAHGTAIEVVAPPALYVRGDRGYIGGTVFHLLENARIHGAPSVRAVVARHGAEIRLTVEDHGPGLPAGFEARAGRLPFRIGEGIGLRGSTGFGLVLDGAVAEAHGGTLRYSRDEGVTRFTLTLPAWGGRRAGSGG